jgi:hypothetical protein
MSEITIRDSSTEDVTMQDIPQIGMNQTERKAYLWLIKKGYRADDIIFQRRGTPDFMIVHEKGYEVKRTHGITDKSVWVTHAQYTRIKEIGCEVLVYTSKSAEPIIISNENFIPGVVQGFKIIVGDIEKGKTLNIRKIDPEARGLLYRLQAEKNLPNLAETIAFLIKKYYKTNNQR